MSIDRYRKVIANQSFRYYVAIGLIAFGVEYVSFVVLYDLSSWLFLSQTASFLTGFLVSFTGSRKFTFANAGTGRVYTLSVRGQLWRYAVLAACNIVLTNLLIQLLVFVVPALLAKVCVMVLVVVWNYAIFTKLIFKSK